MGIYGGMSPGSKPPTRHERFNSQFPISQINAAEALGLTLTSLEFRFFVGLMVVVCSWVTIYLLLLDSGVAEPKATVVSMSVSILFGITITLLRLWWWRKQHKAELQILTEVERFNALVRMVDGWEKLDTLWNDGQNNDVADLSIAEAREVLATTYTELFRLMETVRLLKETNSSFDATELVSPMLKLNVQSKIKELAESIQFRVDTQQALMDMSEIPDSQIYRSPK